MKNYRSLLSEYKLVQGKCERIESKKFSLFEIPEYFQEMKPMSFFVVEEGGFPEGSTYWTTVIRTKDRLYAYNDNGVATYAGDQVSITLIPTEEKWKEIFLNIGPENIKLSHYDYLELVIEDFWLSVFNKSMQEMWCGGIISAHGDKCYGYDREWEKAGISFRRGSLIFLLSYTKELGERPKHETCEWVIENYTKYLPFILAAEQKAGLISLEAQDAD